MDVKKLGRIPDGRAGHRVHGNRKLQRSPRMRDATGRERKLVGWEYVHVCVDDATRLADAEVLPDEKATTAVGFFKRAIAFYRRHGIRVERVMSDNGACYRSTVHAIACRALGVRHLRTQPYRPRTNGVDPVCGRLSAWAARLGQEGCSDAENPTSVSAGVPPPSG